MTEAEKYLKQERETKPHIDSCFYEVRTVEDYEEESVFSKEQVIAFSQSYADEQVNKALEEIEKSLPSDNTIEKAKYNPYFKKGVALLRNKVQEVINNLREKS